MCEERAARGKRREYRGAGNTGNTIASSYLCVRLGLLGKRLGNCLVETLRLCCWGMGNGGGGLKAHGDGGKEQRARRRRRARTFANPAELQLKVLVLCAVVCGIDAAEGWCGLPP